MVHLWSTAMKRVPTLSSGVDLGQNIRYGDIKAWTMLIKARLDCANAWHTL
jgi:hypothetical protein